MFTKGKHDGFENTFYFLFYLKASLNSNVHKSCTEILSIDENDIIPYFQSQSTNE